MRPALIKQIIGDRVGKKLDITFRSGEVVHAKVISADKDLEDEADFYFIDLDRAPDAKFIDEGRMQAHVYSGVYDEVKEVEIPFPEKPQG